MQTTALTIGMGWEIDVDVVQGAIVGRASLI